MLNIHKFHVEDMGFLDKVVLFVECDGIVIYETNLVSQLNSNPFLSKD